MSKMKIFGTKCSYCDRFQLAIEPQLGIKVKCNLCLRDFVCQDETGFLSFVKSGNEESSYKFNKKISKSFFTYGIGIPVSMHDVVRSRLSSSIEIGNIMPVTLRVAGIDFPVNLRYFESNKKEICLHLLWLGGSKLQEKLKEIYNEQYVYFVIKGNTLGKKSWKVSVSLSEEEDVFILDEDNCGLEHQITTRPKPRDKDFDDIDLDSLLR
jgi:hypothetical protein